MTARASLEAANMTAGVFVGYSFFLSCQRVLCHLLLLTFGQSRRSYFLRLKQGTSYESECNLWRLSILCGEGQNQENVSKEDRDQRGNLTNYDGESGYCCYA